MPPSTPLPSPPPRHPDRGRTIPSLDGLRALSVLAVVLGHAALHARGLPVALVAALDVLGVLGVRVFFVMSGFLITTRLLEDAGRAGRPALGRFYLRRTLRIAPPFYCYLATVAVLRATGRLPATGRMWPTCAYVSNLVHSGGWYVAHTWSLSVEEQFYVVWPLTLALVGRRRATWVAVGTCAVMPAVRLLATLWYHSGWTGGTFAFDFLAAGCLLALAPAAVRRAVRWTSARGVLIAAGLVGAYAVQVALAGAVGWAIVVQHGLLASAQAATITAALAWCVARPSTRVGRLLNSRPLRAVGVGSYSVYLWQQLFFAPGLPTSAVGGAALATAVLAALSYNLVERPSLRARARVERWWADRGAAAGRTLAFQSASS